jgi:rhamnosyltransferase
MRHTTGTQVCGVVISYRPSRDLLLNVQRTLSQVDHVIIVDNTSLSDSTASGVLGDLEHLETCTVIRNRINLGVATALNIGIRLAITKGFPWVITLDQDSWMRDGYIREMLFTHQNIASPKVAMLCPRYEDSGVGKVCPPLKSPSGEVLVCMTSGALIPVNTFNSLGLMEDDLFIDSVDHEYCLRLRAAGFKIIECPGAILVHSLGRITEHKLLNRAFITTNHNARRRYYITRNRLVLMRRYLLKDREWATLDCKRMAKETAIIFMVEENRLSKARYMTLALWDAMFNRLGQTVAL